MNALHDHFKLASGLVMTGSAITVAWTTVDMLLRMGASVCGIVAGLLSAAVAIRALRRK